MCYFTHQMWCDDPFSQKNKTTERAMGVGAGVGGNREGGFDKILKWWFGNIVGLHKIGGLGPLCQLWFQIIKFS